MLTVWGAAVGEVTLAVRRQWWRKGLGNEDRENSAIQPQRTTHAAKTLTAVLSSQNSRRNVGRHHWSTQAQRAGAATAAMTNCRSTMSREDHSEQKARMTAGEMATKADPSVRQVMSRTWQGRKETVPGRLGVAEGTVAKGGWLLTLLAVK